MCKLKYFNSLLPQKLHASSLPQKITPFLKNTAYEMPSYVNDRHFDFKVLSLILYHIITQNMAEKIILCHKEDPLQPPKPLLQRGVAVTSLGVSTKLLYIRRARLILGWMTVFGRQTTSVFHQATQANSALLSAGREMSTSQSAVMLCGWGVKAGMAHSTCR